MACEYLLGGNHPLCLLVQGLMSPSLSEMRAYCTSDDPSQCPLHQRHAATQQKVALDAAVVLLGTGAGAMVRHGALRKPNLAVENWTLSGRLPHPEYATRRSRR